MSNRFKIRVKRMLREVINATGVRRKLQDVVYTDRATLARGLKRRGDFGFIPRALSKECQFLMNLDLTGKNVYDIGGYIGTTAAYFAKAVGSGAVIVFEPNPLNMLRIKDRIAINHFENVRFLQVGVSEKRGELQFYFDPRRTARGSFDESRKKESDAKRVTIEVDSLDHLIEVEKLPPPDFIKLDVEGHEVEALHGMKQTLETIRPEMHIEIHLKLHREVYPILWAHGYSIYDVEAQRAVPRGQIDSYGALHIFAKPEDSDPGSTLTEDRISSSTSRTML